MGRAIKAAARSLDNAQKLYFNASWINRGATDVWLITPNSAPLVNKVPLLAKLLLGADVYAGIWNCA